MGNGINYFDDLYSRIKVYELTENAYLAVIEAYLEGKPATKKKSNQISNHAQFWHSDFVTVIPPNILESEAFILALAAYFAQEATSNHHLVEQVLCILPESVRKAIRRSEIVLKQNHSKWAEINNLVKYRPDELGELVSICKAFQQSHIDRIAFVERSRGPFIRLTVFEILAYSALYSFKFLATKAISFDGTEISVSAQLRVMTKLIEWKISCADESDFTLHESNITQALKTHHIPLVFPSDVDSSIPEYLLDQFEKYVKAQVELDEFLSQSVHPFCFNDSLRFEMKDTQLDMIHLTTSAENSWDRNGKRQKLLRGFWLNQALESFIESGLASQQMGSAENHEANQFAYTRALASLFELQNVYGLGETLSSDNGLNVNLFQALLSQELMSSFYIKDYILAFNCEYDQTKDWQKAVGRVAMKGLVDGKNRFPITWSKRKDKANNIVGWTVSPEFPRGNLKAAEAILDFWSLDLKKLSNQIKSKKIYQIPELTERPIIKIGDYCVQLPWVISSQIGSVSAINNLRRFANLRPALKSETTRIENKLGDAFSNKGFTVIKNYTPDTVSGPIAGEIDLICADDIVIVIEVKSTYYRTSPREAVYHRNKTLRKAGKQVARKVAAVKKEIANGCELLPRLNLNTVYPKVIGWVADTSIEFDHEYFAGFLKVTVEELLVALTDRVYLLFDFEEQAELAQKTGVEMCFVSKPFSLYENGINGQEFVNVIEQSRVWELTTK